MGYPTLVWAYKRLPELNEQLGFAECDSELAEKLIKSGKAQDTKIGALHLKEIDYSPMVVEKPKAEKPVAIKK